MLAAGLTAAMMVGEIAGGYGFNSMALLADGWHMGSHALALGLSAGAYAAARRLAGDTRFAFGTWKIEVLADRKSTRLNSSHLVISYAVFCLKKKKKYRVALCSSRSSTLP